MPWRHLQHFYRKYYRRHSLKRFLGGKALKGYVLMWHQHIIGAVCSWIECYRFIKIAMLPNDIFSRCYIRKNSVSRSKTNYFYLDLLGFKEIDDNIQIYSVQVLDASRSFLFKRPSKWLLFRLNFRSHCWKLFNILHNFLLVGRTLHLDNYIPSMDFQWHKRPWIICL